MKVNAAAAANKLFCTCLHVTSGPDVENKPLVWILFWLAPAMSAAEATMKHIHERINRMKAPFRAPPGLALLPQQRHFVTPIMTVCATKRNKNAPAARPVAMSVEYWHFKVPRSSSISVTSPLLLLAIAPRARPKAMR